MSIQLIVYPQSYDGIPNPISTSSSQVVANPTNFTAVTTANSVSLGTVANVPQAAINAIQPTIVSNTWNYGWGAGGSQTDGTTTGIPIFAYSALLQKFGNLVVNGVYDLDINWVVSSGSTVLVSVYNGTVLTGQTGLISSSTASAQFTAPSANDTTIVISYNAQLGGEVIESVQGSFATVQPSGATNVLGNGQVIVDLYEDEDIPLTLSVDDFKNVAEKVQSYSKAFNLPATKRNNQIFNNIFEITRSDDGIIFNPYKKTQCVLKQDGFILFEGYLRMLDVTDKEGETSYNVNLYSEVVALADVLGDRAFRDLDFTELEHDYNYTEIRNSWQGTLNYSNAAASGFRTGSTVKYPFVDWNHNYTFGATGNPVLPSLETAFRPFINIKYLIDRIFEATPFTYTSEFFDELEFGKLFMDFNWGSENTPFTIDDSGNGWLDSNQAATTSYVTIQTNDNNFPTNLGYSAGVYTALLDNQTYNHNYIWAYSVVGSGAWTIDLRWKMVKGGVTSYINTQQISGSGGSSAFAAVSGNFTQILNTGDTLEPEFKSASAGTHTILILETGSIFGGYGANLVNTSASAATNNTFLQTLRGELGQWDFLKGLITMFNLVTLPDEDNPNNIIIEPYQDVFIDSDDSVQLNWTDKIDISSMKLEPLTDLNKTTIFKFVEDDDDYAFNRYKNQVGGHLYGSKKFPEVPDDRFNILFGEEEIVAEPFAATVIKPLDDNFPDLITPAVYSYNADDGTSEGFDNSPRIMYANGIVEMSSTTYFVPTQNGVSGNNVEFQFLQFSHLSAIPTATGTKDFHFGQCQLIQPVGAPVPDNLFNLYWLPYFSELYNPNTRTMTIKVNLTPADINTFKFNDTVFIKNRVFRVNKIDYKPNDLATVEFILIP